MCTFCAGVAAEAGDANPATESNGMKRIVKITFARIARLKISNIESAPSPD
jgi:hypothetical protein